MAAGLADSINRLRQLSRPVPRPLQLPVESAVDEVQAQTGVRFHEDFRRYLLEASDVVVGTLEPVTIGGGHTNFGDVLSAARNAGIPDDWMPVCEDNGDYYCVTPSGEVAFWSHNGTTDETWSDLATWIDEVWIGGR